MYFFLTLIAFEPFEINSEGRHWRRLGCFLVALFCGVFFDCFVLVFALSVLFGVFVLLVLPPKSECFGWRFFLTLPKSIPTWGVLVAIGMFFAWGFGSCFAACCRLCC